MALAKKQNNSTRIVIIGAVVLIVAGIGYFLFQELFVKTNNTNQGSAASQQKGVITNYGESILTDPRYAGLRSYGAMVNADANQDGGQPNPFQ